MPTYRELFKIFLDSNQYFRRRLYSIKDLHKWIKSLNINHFFENESNFFIFMEYLYQKKMVTPFFKLEFPKEHRFRVKLGKYKILINDYRIHSWEELLDEDIIKFIDSEVNFDEKWNHEQKQIPVENGLIAIEETIYFYHPIQFIQILTIVHTLIKDRIQLLSIRTFRDFYWKRWFDFNEDVRVRGLKRIIEESGRTIQEIIEERIQDQGILSEEIPYRGRIWLKPETFKLFIKVESIFSHRFCSPSSPKPTFIFKRNIMSEEKREEAFRKYRKIQDERIKTPQNYFTVDEINQIEFFSQSLKTYFFYKFDGFDSWLDILIQMGFEKLNKLKGSLSYYMNLF